MIKSTILIAFLISVSLTALSQKNVNSLVVVSYNVENLFDTVNSPLFDDDAFTPEGSKKWTSDRYEKKVTDLAMVLGSIPGSELPAVIGLTEIENRKVLEDLINDPKLRKGAYEIIHDDGVDPRVIECALFSDLNILNTFLTIIFPSRIPLILNTSTGQSCMFREKDLTD